VQQTTADVIWNRPSGRLPLVWEVPSGRFGMTDGGVIRRSAGWGSEIHMSHPRRQAVQRPWTTTPEPSSQDPTQYSQDLLGATWPMLPLRRPPRGAYYNRSPTISHATSCFTVTATPAPRSARCALATTESFNHIQCWCPTLKKALTPPAAAHHTIWRELITLIKTYTKAVLDSKDVPVGKWSFPSVINSSMVQEWSGHRQAHTE